MSPQTRLVIFGYGNPSRGDDALGSLLLARAETEVDRLPGLDVALVEDFQLQVEHALDLEDRDLALFIDAAETGPMAEGRGAASGASAFIGCIVPAGGAAARSCGKAWRSSSIMPWCPPRSCRAR